MLYINKITDLIINHPLILTDYFVFNTCNTSGKEWGTNIPEKSETYHFLITARNEFQDFGNQEKAVSTQWI